MEPDATTTTTVEEYLGLVRGGIRILSSIKEKATLYITSTLGLESGEEVGRRRAKGGYFVKKQAPNRPVRDHQPFCGKIRLAEAGPHPSRRGVRGGPR